MSRRVEVYRNLHTDTWSVRELPSGLVVDHPVEFVVRNAEFVVRPTGRDKVRKEKRKNVHAFVRGDEGSLDRWRNACISMGARIFYDPYKNDTFVTEFDVPVSVARYVYMDDGFRLYALGVD